MVTIQVTWIAGWPGGMACGNKDTLENIHQIVTKPKLDLPIHLLLS